MGTQYVFCEVRTGLISDFDGWDIPLNKNYIKGVYQRVPSVSTTF
jgi:hypothetical protein